MAITTVKVNEYIGAIASDAPVPGGGSASAVCAAQGAALAAMVARLTVGREKFAQFNDTCENVIKAEEALCAKLLEAAEKDSEAFDKVMAAYKMPKSTEEEKKARSSAIADATLIATEMPFCVMNMAYEALLEANNLVGKSNPNAASDLGVSAMSLLTGIKGAHLNVLINLGGVKNEEKAARFASEGERIEKDAEKIAGEIYNAVLENIKG